MRVRIGLLGDVMLGRSVGEALRAGVEPAELWSPDLRELARSLDLVICNLQCCLSTRGTPTTLISDKPFFFRGPPQAVDSLHAIGVRVVGLANNHLLDFGVDAGADTVALLRRAGLATAGAGSDVTAARAPAIVECAGKRIGVLALADHPAAYAADAHRFGTAVARLRDGPPDWLLDVIAELRTRCEIVIAFVHWGPNMTSRPAAWQRDVATALCAAGADLLAGHSAHVFHGVGFDHQHPVIYDLGDALDDYRIDPVLRNDLGILAIWTPGVEEVELRTRRPSTRLLPHSVGQRRGGRLDRRPSRARVQRAGRRVERAEPDRFRIRPA